MRLHRTLVAALLLTSLASRAHADIAPPAGFEESCTLEKKARAGYECHLCRAYHGNHDHCPESLSAFGFTQTCRARGASVWSEIWCRAESPTAAKVPASIIAQLGDAQGKPSPLQSASALPSSAPPSTSASAPSAPSAAPSAAPVATAKPAKPAPPPASLPKAKSGCSVSGSGSADASLLALGVAMVVALRRRR